MNDHEILRLTRHLGISDLLARVMVGREVGLDGAERWLRPRLDRDLPDPLTVLDMEVAVERLAGAVTDGEAIGILGDYDVDGSTATALFVRYLREVAREPEVWIPDRMTEGYGPSRAAMDAFCERNVRLVITVDCGTTAFDALGHAAECGLDVIVVDHHVAATELPKATAVVNPNRPDDPSDLGPLSAVGVAFFLVMALQRELRNRGWFAERPEPDLREWLDLVALGTVCDLAPLRGVNRLLVRRGLAVMGRRRNPGLRALARQAGAPESPGVDYLGFVLGPRINAAGRVGTCEAGARILVTDDQAEAEVLAGRLEDWNRQRRQIEATVLEEAEARFMHRTREGGDPPIVVVSGPWHPGVVGIVAGRLVDRWRRPAVVVGEGEHEWRGSARSMTGFDVGALIVEAREAGLLRSGGGHPMAGGFSLDPRRFDALEVFLTERASERLNGRRRVDDLWVDGLLTVAGATPDLVDELDRAGPFGQGNPAPRFVLPKVFPVASRVVGSGHVSCFLADETTKRVRGIAFRSAGDPLGKALLRGRPLDIAGRLRSSVWQGNRRIEVEIDDAMERGP